MLFDPGFERFCVCGLDVKDHVTARDKCLYVSKAQLDKQITQLVHFYGVTANIDGSQESYVFGHICFALRLDQLMEFFRRYESPCFSNMSGEFPVADLRKFNTNPAGVSDVWRTVEFLW